MKKLAIILLCLAIISGILGYSRLMGVAVYFGWILGVVAVVLFLYQAATGKKVV
ncbi:MAG: DUF1328 domain-containing protein [Verrucomicrobiales bacterium]|nr:DUF1328 domain-containing protein [Verrucomicrobiales bacterium]